MTTDDSKNDLKRDLKNNSNIYWAFFGSSNFSVLVLDELEHQNLLPQLIVTTPDKPKGRGLKVQLGDVRTWAEQRNIPVLSPATLKNEEIKNELIQFVEKADFNSNPKSWDTFLVASYGKIVPADIFNIPKKGTLNIHPSLLPKFRGPTPLESSIIAADETGVTIMKIDEQVDHGAIVAQKAVPILGWPPYYRELETTLATEGAKLFAEILPDWISGKIEATEQEHLAATFTKKFLGGGLRILLEDEPKANLRKIRAFAGNRGTYFLLKHKETEVRLIITAAKIEQGELVIERVIPEGKKEMNYEDFKRGLR